MIVLKLSNLQEKDVVNIINGDNLGRIIDADVNESGLINYFVVEKKRYFWQIFKGSSSDKKVYFTKIKKIGHDVILVEL